MWSCAGVLVLASAALALTRDQFYPFGPGVDHELPRGAEVASEEIQLNPEVPILFYGEEYTSIFVNNYGVLTFRAEISSFINSEFPLPYSSIAALYTNVDTTNSGVVYYRETMDSHVLLKAEVTVQSSFHEYFDFKPRAVFIATWIDVTYDSSTDKKNSFQVAVISNGTETFVELLYPEREIQWIQKETRPNSSPEAKAQAGFIAEDGRVFTLKGSGSHLVRNIALWSNVHEPGKYVYRVGNIPPESNIEDPDQYNQDEEEESTCAQSGPSLCHFQARCVDYQAGLCCQCNDGFYGNGKSCIKDDVPLRVHGKLNGNLNNITLENVDVQAYVVVIDGRSYTALSQAPNNLGSSLQLLNVIGSSIGWLFAKPLADAKNGYQLSGALFNHSADIFFPETNDKVSLSQIYLGHDVFDQITLEAEAEGTLPYVPNLSKLDVGEYEEQYTYVEFGVIKSESTRTFTDKATRKQYTVVISQQFSFSPCKYAPQDGEVTSTIKFFKNFLGYEGKENIVRYGMSTKVTPLGREDPCVAGRSSCGVHSDCVVKGDSFQCVCQRGYKTDDYGACVDLDECIEFEHNCDVNAECLNHEGGFRCICRQGYEGDGRACQLSYQPAYTPTPQSPPSACSFKTCDPNAKCYESIQGATCVCNQGYKGDGSFCWGLTDCNSCSPYAECVRLDPRSPCRCRPGYIGNGYTCDKERTTTEQYLEQPPQYPSQYPTAVDPSAGTIELAVCESEFNCVCPDGYEMFVDDQQITLCRLLVYYPNVEGTGETEPHNSSIKCQSEADCPPNAVCSYSETSGDYECSCPEGYEGDGYECMERAGPTCHCGPHSHCIGAGDVNECSCDPGFHSDGYECRPNFSCTVNSDCEYHAECRPDPRTGDYLCQCIDGYKKDQNDACIPDGACSGAICAQHASCLYDRSENINYCSCDQGYTGNPIDNCDLVQNLEVAETCDSRPDICSPDAQCTFNGYAYECICREGFTGDGYSCNPEATCRNNPYLCNEHASCLRRGGNYVCECNTGYSGNGSDCTLNPRQLGNFLVASDGMFIYRVPLQVSSHDVATPINKVSDQIAVAIDVDCQTQRVYWSDLVTSTIKSSAYDGSDFQLFLTEGIKSPEGISIDWSARNIFWTDARKKTIEVANLDTRRRKVLFSDGILNPRGIVAHPQRGKIFWSDWNRSSPKIEWASMDGSERGVFLGKPHVQLPNALAIEFSTDRLCYSDAGLKTIECVQMDSLQRDTIATECPYPFGLAINKGTFYWTDWKTLKIEYVNQNNVKGFLPIATASKKLFGVAVALDQCRVYSNVCQYYNGNCGVDEICLPDGRANRTCVLGD